MCGIVGCVAKEGCYQRLFTALRRLEYRGYDSAGVAFLGEGGLCVRKRRGGVKNIEGEPMAGSAGIGHTRWATHGAPSDVNAHPHLCGKFALVHNGIIENAAALRAELERAGERFVSQTDSEVIVHLIAGAYAGGDTRGMRVSEGGGQGCGGAQAGAGGGAQAGAGGGQVCGGAHADTGESVKVCGGGQGAAHIKEGGFFAAVAAACARLQGSYAIAVLCADCPEQMVCARRGSPLVAGAGEGALYVCSDVPALAGLASYVCPAADGEFIHICNGRIRFLRADGAEAAKTFSYLPPQTPAPAPEGCRMLAEIAETPRALHDTLACLREVNFLPHARRFARAERVFAVACGTAYHAALGFAAALEGSAGIPVLHCRASEFFARAPLVRPSSSPSPTRPFPPSPRRQTCACPCARGRKSPSPPPKAIPASCCACITSRRKSATSAAAAFRPGSGSFLPCPRHARRRSGCSPPSMPSLPACKRPGACIF